VLGAGYERYFGFRDFARADYAQDDNIGLVRYRQDDLLETHLMHSAEAKLLLAQRALPPGSVIEDDLIADQSDTSIPVIPSGSHFKAKVVCPGNPDLKTIGSDVRVDDDFIADGCPVLESIGCGLNVARDCDFSDCPSLLTIGEEVRVGGTLNLAGCPANINLPSKGFVGEELILPEGYDHERISKDFHAAEVSVGWTFLDKDPLPEVQATSDRTKLPVVAVPSGQ